MKYNTVQVRPSHNSTQSKRVLEVSYDKTPLLGNVQSFLGITIEHVLNFNFQTLLGFFHYPETVSNDQARTDLIQCMILKHDQEIAELIASRNALKNLLTGRKL